MRGILLESQVVLAERCECHDDRVARVDFQYRLGGDLETSRAGQELLQLTIEPGFRRNQAHSAIGQAVGGADVRHRLAQRLLDEGNKIRHCLIGLRGRLFLGIDARDERQIRRPLGHRLERLALEGGA